jgi:hypothetical protein
VTDTFPAVLQCRAESTVEKLLADQAAATAAFVAIVKTAQAGIAALKFPLGSPARIFELTEITDCLSDWQDARRDEDLRWEAEDRVLKALDGLPAT